MRDKVQLINWGINMKLNHKLFIYQQCPKCIFLFCEFIYWVLSFFFKLLHALTKHQTSSTEEAYIWGCSEQLKCFQAAFIKVNLLMNASQTRSLKAFLYSGDCLQTWRSGKIIINSN